MITQSRLKELMEYDPLTGIFSRKTKKGGQEKESHPGTVNKDGYIHMMIDRKIYKAHRLAWLYIYGRFPFDQIDHEDGDRANNRIKNLREVDNEGNSHNQHRSGERNTSGFVGVTFRKKLGKYQARIRVKYKEVSIGYFNSAIDAHQAYIKSKRILHGFSTI